MAVSLFSHNETAYLATASMLTETGRAAIIHPTGTGKSFIGFRLCEDNPNCTICWLALSEYIWVIRQRTLYQENKLPAEQVRMLEEIGMVWETEDPWEVGYRHAELFFEANGHQEMPGQYVCEDGYRLGKWLGNQRAKHNKLRKVLFSNRKDKRFQIGFAGVEAIHVRTENAELFNLFNTQFSVHRSKGLLIGGFQSSGAKNGKVSDLLGWIIRQTSCDSGSRLVEHIGEHIMPYYVAE